MIILIIGIGLLATSLLADVIGLGDPGFGPKQTTGTIAGVVITAGGCSSGSGAKQKILRVANQIDKRTKAYPCILNDLSNPN